MFFVFWMQRLKQLICGKYKYNLVGRFHFNRIYKFISSKKFGEFEKNLRDLMIRLFENLKW